MSQARRVYGSSCSRTDVSTPRGRVGGCEFRARITALPPGSRLARVALLRGLSRVAADDGRRSLRLGEGMRKVIGGCTPVGTIAGGFGSSHRRHVRCRVGIARFTAGGSSTQTSVCSVGERRVLPQGESSQGGRRPSGLQHVWGWRVAPAMLGPRRTKGALGHREPSPESGRPRLAVMGRTPGSSLVEPPRERGASAFADGSSGLRPTESDASAPPGATPSKPRARVRREGATPTERRSTRPSPRRGSRAVSRRWRNVKGATARVNTSTRGFGQREHVLTANGCR